MKINKFKAEASTILGIPSLTGKVELSKVKKGWWYYEFITSEKTWIRHSGKLTKEEKSIVIKWEMQNESNNY